MTRRTDPRTTRLPVPAGQAPTFTPVPRQGKRHDGWTDKRQHDFIEALTDTGSVHAACKAVNMSQAGAYYLRRQPGADSFRAAWQAALDLGVEKIEDLAMDRALNGVEVPVFAYGDHVGSRRIYNDRLLMFILRNRSPERFGATLNGGSGAKGLGGLNAVGQMELTRIKKRWLAEARKEWEAEQEAERHQVSPAEIRASIERKVEKLREQVAAEKAAQWEALSEETRKAIERAETLKARDLARAGQSNESTRHYLPSPTLESVSDPSDERQNEPAREEEPEDKKGPGVRTVKDEGWE